MVAYAQQADIPKTSMLADVERLSDNLSEILMRLVKIADTLHGPEPREACAVKNQTPIQSVRTSLNAAFGVSDRIFMEISRIESSL